jgi:TonB family protein
VDAVDQVLAQRVRRQDRSRPWASLGAAALLHAAAVGIALLLPHLEKPPQPLQFVPVTVIPAQALGVERPLARPNPPAAKPEVPEAAPPAPTPAPTPAAEPEPEPPRPKPAPKPIPKPKPAPEEREPPVDRRPALPEPEAKPRPEPARPAAAEKVGKGTEKGKKPAPARPQPAAPSQGHAGAGGVAAVGKGEEIGRRGSAAGNPLGTSGLGSQIAGVEDPEFGYGYYLDRLLQLIDANWTRPPMGSGVKATLHFRIQKDGGIDELRIEESSGYNSFDLAALRAVQNAAPFPALPASYRHDSLGVSLIVR